MRKIISVLALASATTLAVLAGGGSANAADTNGTIHIVANVSASAEDPNTHGDADMTVTHDFTGSIDATGNFTADGTTNVAHGGGFGDNYAYANNEHVVGTFKNGVLTFEAQYGGSTYDWQGNAKTANLVTGGAFLPGAEWGTLDGAVQSGDFVYSHAAMTGSVDVVPAVVTPDPTPVVVGNHGQCVSGATHAGIKGKALAEIAKVNTLVGEYGSTTCPKVS